MQDDQICEYVALVLTAGYDCGANHYWFVEQINDRLDAKDGKLCMLLLF